MTKWFSGLLIFFAVFNVASITNAQWWGSETLPGNPNDYTYKTRFGYWQYGALTRNISTPQKFADRGIIRNWNDGVPIAVDRNLPGGRFAQQGVPNLVYVPRIDYFDKHGFYTDTNIGYYTDIKYREGLRQYWPDNQQILNHEWEQKTYGPEYLPENADQVTPTANVLQTITTVPAQSPQNRIQTFVIKQVSVQAPEKSEEKKLTYHERVMQGHAERRATDEERYRLFSQQLAEQSAANQPEASPRAINPYELQPDDPRWFRDLTPQPLQPIAVGSPMSFGQGFGMTTYSIPVDPVAEREKQLEYALVQSPEISFYSSFQAKYEDGTVTITGLVGSSQQRQTAERILLTQPGVKNVQNLLAVAE